jgi:hypothetical protein
MTQDHLPDPERLLSISSPRVDRRTVNPGKQDEPETAIQAFAATAAGSPYGT